MRACVRVCVRARACAYGEVSVSVQVSVCNHIVCVKCFSVDVCIYSIILCFSDCHDSIGAFLIVMLLIYALFYRTCDYVSVCEML